MNKQHDFYLGIDTSNYTTSLAICDEYGNVVANIKKLLDVKEGERGLRQSDAVFAHIKNIPELTSKIKEIIKDGKIVAVGVSTKPRDVEGSYMPCFLSGKAVAYGIGAAVNVPVYEFSHQVGHIMAALYSCGCANEIVDRDFIAFHVSGGTTETLYVTPNSYSFNADILADTADISAGQAIDRTGVMMGLKFPCGKEIETLAKQNINKLPPIKVSVNNGKVNFSGLENISNKLYAETNDKSLVSAYVLSFVSKTLVKLTCDIREKYPLVPIVYAGGVMSNAHIKSELSKFENVYFAMPEFSSDNAAGIALLTHRTHR